MSLGRAVFIDTYSFTHHTYMDSIREETVKEAQAPSPPPLATSEKYPRHKVIYRHKH
jgi:hypothetical protein